MNETKAEGFYDEAKGKIKQAWGEATDNRSLANEGAADQVKGNAEQTWGSVKDAAHESTHSSSTTADTETGETRTTSTSLRDDFTSAAQHVKESVQHGLDDLKKKNDN